MKTDRRGFLESLLMASAAAGMSGCASARSGGTGGGSMQGFVAPKPKDGVVRVGVVGIGSRGSSAVYRLAETIPHVQVTAMADVRPERFEMVRGVWEKKYGAGKFPNGLPFPTCYDGEEGYKKLCEDPNVDVVYCTTHWALHTPVSIYAMTCGKHALVETPAGVTEDECWSLVETAEKRRVHCMLTENCCYGEDEMLALNMCRLGIFGQLVHGQCGYIHEMRKSLFVRRWRNWRLWFNAKHKGNYYPTHGLGPICQYMDINRGDRLTTLVSMESDQFAVEEWARDNLPAGDSRRSVAIEAGDQNTTLIRTAKGRLITVCHNVMDVTPYTRYNYIQGTHGSLMGWPLRIFVEGSGQGDHDPAFTEKFREMYRHPLWKKASEAALKQGGHGGMDFMMDLRWTYCLRNGLPFDIDVYDSATWSVVAPLSERSVRERRFLEVPDFTRGGWKTAKPLGIEASGLG